VPKKWVWIAAVLAVISISAAQAADDSMWDGVVRRIGKAVYFAAFPTATYRGADLSVIRPGADGTDVVFVVYGVSAFGGGNLWTEVIATEKDGRLVGLRWGANNAILAKPGETLRSVGKLLEDLNRQAQAGQTRASTVRMTWVLSNRCGDESGAEVRFFDVTRNFVWPPENKVYVLARGETLEVSLDTYGGDSVCVGATPYVASPTFYWGVGLASEHSCKDCCYLASPAT
jgi:hypothetical protein